MLVFYVIVPPSEVSLTLPVFEANILSSSTQCQVPTVKPGIGSLVFTITIGSDFSTESSNGDLDSTNQDTNTGTVSVTYSPQISLQRKHNGLRAVCTVVWREGEKTLKAESEAVDVRCKYINLYLV